MAERTTPPTARGTINFFETHIGAWEEHVTDEVPRRLRAVLGHLGKRGFCIEQDLNYGRGWYVGRKGDLELAAHACGRMFEIEFFQNVANVENRNGGRYDFGKFARMPRTMQLTCAVEMSRVLRKLLGLGYVLEGRRQGITSANLLAVLRHAQGRTDEGDPLAAFNRSWNFESDWEHGGRFERDESGWPSMRAVRSWPGLDRDSVPLVSGETMYCRRRGRLVRGVARPSVNDNWILISNGHAVCVHARELFRCEDPAAEPRRFMPQQLERLHTETEKALTAKAYGRVAALSRAAARIANDALEAAS